MAAVWQEMPRSNWGGEGLLGTWGVTTVLKRLPNNTSMPDARASQQHFDCICALQEPCTSNVHCRFRLQCTRIDPPQTRESRRNGLWHDKKPHNHAICSHCMPPC